MEWLRRVWVKGKWYILAVAAAVVVVLGVLLKTKDDGATQKLLELVFDRQKKLVQNEVERKLKKEKVIDVEIKKLDNKIKKLDEKREAEKKRVDTMDLKELADAWKELGM